MLFKYYTSKEDTKQKIWIMNVYNNEKFRYFSMYLTQFNLLFQAPIPYLTSSHVIFDLWNFKSFSGLTYCNGIFIVSVWFTFYYFSKWRYRLTNTDLKRWENQLFTETNSLIILSFTHLCMITNVLIKDILLKINTEKISIPGNRKVFLY